MSSKIEENAYFVEAERKADNRKIYIKATLELNQWVKLCDTLTDCEFIMRKMEKEAYYAESQKSLWAYNLDVENSEKFSTFVMENYVNTIKIFKKNKSKS